MSPEAASLENLHFWFDKETTMSRQFIYKKAIELYCDLWKLFYFKLTEITVEIQLISLWLAMPLSLSDYRKEEIIRSMNLINGFGATGYSIRGIHLPNSPINVIAYNV